MFGSLQNALPRVTCGRFNKHSCATSSFPSRHRMMPQRFSVGLDLSSANTELRIVLRTKRLSKYSLPRSSNTRSGGQSLLRRHRLDALPNGSECINLWFSKPPPLQISHSRWDMY